LTRDWTIDGFHCLLHHTQPASAPIGSCCVRSQGHLRSCHLQLAIAIVSPVCLSYQTVAPSLITISPLPLLPRPAPCEGLASIPHPSPRHTDWRAIGLRVRAEPQFCKLACQIFQPRLSLLRSPYRGHSVTNWHQTRVSTAILRDGPTSIPVCWYVSFGHPATSHRSCCLVCHPSDTGRRDGSSLPRRTGTSWVCRRDQKRVSYSSRRFFPTTPAPPVAFRRDPVPDSRGSTTIRFEFC
jgi:hypothetical protein